MAVLPFTGAFKGGEKDRRRIFRTAAGVFARKGYHETTVDEIARAIGVAKGTIYYHFKNKEELYLALIQEGINLLKDRLCAALAGAAGPDEKVKGIITSLLCFCEKEKDLVFLFLKELSGSYQHRELLAGMLSECLGTIRSVIEEGMAGGTFRQADPEITTTSLFGMVTISALHYTAYSRKIPLDSASTAIKEIFLKGMAYSSTEGGHC